MYTDLFLVDSLQCAVSFTWAFTTNTCLFALSCARLQSGWEFPALLQRRGRNLRTVHIPFHLSAFESPLAGHSRIEDGKLFVVVPHLSCRK